MSQDGEVTDLLTYTLSYFSSRQVTAGHPQGRGGLGDLPDLDREDQGSSAHHTSHGGGPSQEDLQADPGPHLSLHLHPLRPDRSQLSGDIITLLSC